jgi:uncharacterized lipoprotein YajG
MNNIKKILVFVLSIFLLFSCFNNEKKTQIDKKIKIEKKDFFIQTKKISEF